MKYYGIVRFFVKLFAVALFLSVQIYPQTGWKASFMVNPFPSPYLNDWRTNPSIVSLTITNSERTPQQVKIYLTIGKRSQFGSGESIGRGTSNPIMITPSVPNFINNSTLINWGSVKYDKSIEQIAVQTGRLPEGEYTACIEIRDMNNKTVINNTCRDFQIVYPAPPSLVYPTNNDSISTRFPMFQWTPSVVPHGYNLHYSFRLVEVLPGQTPLQAINANIPQYENKNVLTTSLAYPANALELLRGKKFAWQVQALDQNGYPVAANNGKSEVFVFKYPVLLPLVVIPPVIKLDISTVKGNFCYSSGAPQYPIPPLKQTSVSLVAKYKLAIVKSINTATHAATYDTTMDLPDWVYGTMGGIQKDKIISTTITDNKGDFQFSFVTDSMGVRTDKYISSLKGYLYRYAAIVINSANIINPSGKYIVQPGQNINTGSIVLNDKRTIIKGNLVYEFLDEGEYTGYPLKNKSIKLEIAYVIHDQATGKSIHLPYHAADADKPLDYCTTGPNGEFQFALTEPVACGLFEKDQKIKQSNAEFSSYWTGDVYKVLRITFTDPQHYVSPSLDISVTPRDKYYDLGNVFAKVRGFKLKVFVKTSEQKDAVLPPNTYTAGMQVYVLRSRRLQDVPVNEGVQPSVPQTIHGNLMVIEKGVTDAEGMVQFKKLVSNIMPNDNYYFYACSDSLSELNYDSNIQFSKFGYNNTTEFENEYSLSTEYLFMTVAPKAPLISGYVYRNDNKLKPVNNCTVKLSPVSWGGNPGSSTITNMSGGFIFENLANLIVSKKTPPILLTFSVKGFRDTVISLDGMKWGQKKNFDPPVYMRTTTKVHGRVVASDVDANGIFIGVPSAVTIGDGITVQTYTKYSKESNVANMNITASEGWFDCEAASLLNQKLVIKPFNGYFADTQYVQIAPTADKDMGIRMVKKISHRVQITVYERKPDGSQFTLAPDVLVGIENKTNKQYSSTDGTAKFIFNSPGEDFTVTLEGVMRPVVARKIKIKNKESKDFQDYMVSIDPAVNLKGHVYVGRDNQPVPYATVKLVRASVADTAENFDISVNCSSDGSYILKNVPIGKHVFTASKGNSNFIGDSKSVTLTQTSSENVDFHLDVYDGMDITKLLGFPIAVTKLDSTKKGIYICGEFTNIPDNKYFSAKGNKIKFDSVYIVAGNKKNSKGVPLAYPAQLPLTTSVISLPVSINKIFIGQLRDNKLLKVYADNTGNGTIQGNVYLDAGSSFNFAGGLNIEGLYLGIPDAQNNSEKLAIPAMPATGNFAKALPKGFLAVNQSGDSLKYKFYNMDAAADPANSFVKDTTVKLNTTVNTVIEKVSPISLQLGDVILHKTYLEDVNSTSPISIKLNDWSLNGNQWSVTHNAGFKINQGILKTNVVDVPFTDLYLMPTSSGTMQLQLGKFDFQGMKLAGTVPLTVTGKSDFGYDNSVGYWKLIVSGSDGNSCAYFTGTNLKGLESTAKVEINNFYLQSNGKQAFAVSGTSDLYAYKVASLTPSNLVVYDNSLHIEGQINMHLPAPLSQKQPSAYIFTKNGSGMDFKLQPFTFGDKINGITVDFNKAAQTLDENGFVAKGKIFEEGKFNFDATLYRSADSIAMWVDPNQTLKIGEQKTSLANINGALKVTNNTWQNFWFAGDLLGASGASGRLKFDVIGEVTASGQQLNVSNIPTPFGDLAMTYDFANGRLTGNLQIDKDMLGQGHMNANATMVVDKQGWYFFQGGSFTLASPHSTIQSGILIGDYDVSQDMKNTFMQYSYKAKLQGKLPAGFPQHVNGFYFEGSADVPTPIFPGFDFNFGLISAALWLNVGADTRLAMNFGEVNTYHIGMDYLLDVGAKMGGSIGIACAGVSAQLIIDQGFDGEYRSDGSWYVSGESSLSLQGDTYAGVGCCDSDCDYLGFPCPSPCIAKHLTGSVAIGMRALIGFSLQSHSVEHNIEFFFK